MVTDAAASAAAQLVTGCHLYAGHDGTWRYYLPGDEFVRIGAPSMLLHEAQRRLHGLDHLQPDRTVDAGALEEFLEALRERGVLADPDGAGAGGRAVGTVLVAGDNPIGHAVAELLAGEMTVTTGPVNAAAVAAVDVVVSCAGWLPDEAWLELDGWCTTHGVAWHMCYAEGSRWYVGPMAVPGRTARYADTRARRLAASGAPDELRAHWAYLDAGTHTPSVPWPSRAGAAVLAGLIATDALAYRDRGIPAADGYQLAVDLATTEMVRHPVLPLPRVASGAA